MIACANTCCSSPSGGSALSSRLGHALIVSRVLFLDLGTIFLPLPPCFALVPPVLLSVRHGGPAAVPQASRVVLVVAGTAFFPCRQLSFGPGIRCTGRFMGNARLLDRSEFVVVSSCVVVMGMRTAADSQAFFSRRAHGCLLPLHAFSCSNTPQTRGLLVGTLGCE